MESTTSLVSPLYVDLDGTFTKSDILYECLVMAMKNNPLIIFMCVYWLCKGKSYLKYKLSQQVDISSELLPLNREFYSFLLQEKAKNRKIILATASNEKYAENIYQSYDVFDDYLGSNNVTNLKGQEKLSKIKSLTENFSYAGNSSEDFILFAQAEESYLVNPTKKAKKLSLKRTFSGVFDDNSYGLKVWLEQLRVHQWLKNLLVFVPLLVTSGFYSLLTLFISIEAFLSFGFLASATYIINDLGDLEADRRHQRKRNRPLAAGNISIVHAKVISLLLFVAAFGLALNISIYFSTVLFVYLGLTLFYSFRGKQYMVLDVIVLACLYTIRIVAGAAALNVPVSFWLLSFSMFVFLSLALVKRCSELRSLQKQKCTQVNGRDYFTNDYGVLMNFGTSTSVLSVFVFSSYIKNNIVTNQFQQPSILWLILPALCYWLMRMWVKTHRGEMHDDPIVFSLKDKGSLMTVSFIVIVTILAQVL